MYLCQRLKKKPVQGQVSSLSDCTYFDYMGSAEFEFGELPKARRAMEAARESLSLRKVKHNDHTFFVLGVQEFQSSFEEVLLHDRWKERPCFPGEVPRGYGSYEGWWILDFEPVPGVFFTNKHLAIFWAEFFNVPHNYRVPKT